MIERIRAEAQDIASRNADKAEWPTADIVAYARLSDFYDELHGRWELTYLVAPFWKRWYLRAVYWLGLK